MRKKKKLHFITKIIWHFFEVIVALTFILFILGIWRLTKEPIEIKYIAPILADIFTPEGSDVTVEIDKAFLELALKRGHLLDIKVTNLTVYRPDNSILASIPEGNVSLSIFGLIKGDFIPTSLYLQKPYLDVPITHETSSPPSSQQVVDTINLILSHITSLKKFVIEKGEFVINFKQNNSLLLIPEFSISIEKQDRSELHIRGKTTLYIDGQFIPIWLTGLYSAQTKRLSFEINFKDLDLPHFKFINPILKGFLLNINGQINGSLNLAPQQKELRYIFKNLSFSATLNTPGTIYLPKPLDIYYPLHNMSVNGAFSSHLEQLTLSNSFIDIGGPTAEISSSSTGIGDFLDSYDFSNIHTTLTASIYNVPVFSVPDVWPSSLGSDAHHWVKENLSGGTINNAFFVLNILGNELSSVKGLLNVQDTTVQYMEQMPPIEHVHGKVILQLGRVDIEATQGTSGNLVLKKALLNLTELLGDHPIAHVEIDADGPLDEAFSLINYPPLHLADEFEINPPSVKGLGSVHLTLNFPLNENVHTKDIKVSATASLSNLDMPIPNTSFSLHDAQVNLTASNENLTLTGTSLLNGEFHSSFSCSQSFLPNPPYKSKCSVQTHLLGADLKDVSEKLPDYVAGPMDIDLTIIQKNKKETELLLNADLTQTTLNLWPISYIKNPSVPSSFKARFILKNNLLTEVPDFLLTTDTDHVKINGSLSLNQETLLYLKTIKAPRNNASVRLKKDKNNFISFEITGKSLNLTEVAHGRRLNEQKTPEKATQIRKGALPSFNGKILLNKLYLSPLTPLTDVQINLVKQNNIWQIIDAVAFADKDSITFKLDKNKKQLLASSENIGKILKYTGYTSRIQGGILKSIIKQDSYGTLSGTIDIRDYVLAETPFLVQAMTILGILNAFTEDSIAFKKATIPFTLTPENILTIKDAVASGTTLGLTLNGTLTYDEMNLKGSIFPAYAINSLPGRIPFIGRLFSGDKGGGLFGVSFEATGNPGNPVVSFNPTSILTPGIIRNIFN